MILEKPDLSLRDVIAKVLDCVIVVSEFELQSCYYDHFRVNTFKKGMNSFILLTIS